MVKRKQYTKRQVLEHWEASGGRCWRCGKRIAGKPTPVYGKDWVLGHVGRAHWAGGVKVAPEHADCNAIDGRDQTKLAAKSVRIRAKAIGIKKPSRWAWFKSLLPRPVKCESCGMYAADPPSKLCPGCEAYEEHQA